MNQTTLMGTDYDRPYIKIEISNAGTQVPLHHIFVAPPKETKKDEE